MRFKPMLAEQGNKGILDRPGYIFEPKLDGYRALCYKDKGIKLVSRNGKDITDDYPEIDILGSIRCNSCVLDGEIIAFDENGKPDFSLMQRRRKDDSIKVTFVAFDILEMDGKELLDKPLIERKKILEKTVKESERIQRIVFTGDGKKLDVIMKRIGTEGIVAKRKDSIYIQKRASSWLKVKYAKTLDCVILSMTEKASIEVGLYDKGVLVSVGRIGTGFGGKILDEIRTMIDKGNVPVCEVKYFELTDERKLRGGVFLRLRDDKDPKECTFDQIGEGLERYRSKRDFEKTSEPKGGEHESKKNPIFVIQRHDATRLHYDFRLEDEGVLKSWAVPKGVSMNPSDKRLAVMVEDHPLDYASFEGVIPSGNYGAGTVSIWDKGRFVNITIKKGKVMPLSEAIAKGHFLIWVKGDKISGGFAFTRIGEKKNEWLLVKMRDERKEFPDSATISNHTIPLTNMDKELYAGLKKGDLVEYYISVAPFMLPHIKDRLLSLFRFPDGIADKGFYQKNATDFPGWIRRVKVKDVEYSSCTDKACIAFISNLVATPHIWTSRVDDLGHPDKIVFDMDPSKKDLALLKKACLTMKKLLEDVGLTPFIMTTGGKGYHIVCPIKPELTHKEVREFALKIAEVLVASDPEHLTTEHRIGKRKERIFIDVNRNTYEQTSVAPYAVRQAPGLPIAKPISWKDLPASDPQTYTILDIGRMIEEPDPWKDFERKRVSLRKVMEKLKEK